ncbi:nuclear transport factor 2 family protein, partial [Pseudomonas aeruginosa]
MRSSYRIVSEYYAASSRGDLAGMLVDMDERTGWTEMAGSPLAG